MEKEYFFVLKLKNGTTITLWDIIPEYEATNKCLALHKHYNALSSAKVCPSDFATYAGFLNVMRSHGYKGYWHPSPI